jgi:tRNA threonylcarbamoyladenosine biosynthesis protein TsaB
MLSIAFDISGKGCLVALLDGGEVLGKSCQEMEFGQAEALIPASNGLLRGHGVAFSALGAVIVCVGPGSFSGVRAGIAAAKAFGLANPALKVIGVTAFEALAFHLRHPPSPKLRRTRGFGEQIGFAEPMEVNAAIIDSRRGDFYYQLFDNHFEFLGEPGEDTKEAIAEKAAKLIGEEGIDIESLALCGLEKLRRRKGGPESVKPLYIRPPYACV